MYNSDPIFKPWAEAVGREIQRAERVGPPLPDGIVLQRGDTVELKPYSWVWPGWLAQGKLHLLAGAPGCGKTTICLSLAAAITTGAPWPDGTPGGPPGDVIVWSGEDDIDDTLAPRLRAAGANMKKIHFVRAHRKAGEARPFDPGTDFPALLEAAKGLPNLRMVLVDPIANAVTGDSHKGAEVRRGLQPLVDLAAAADVAVMGISHLSKGGAGNPDPASRVLGSVAFVAVARIVWLAAKTQDDEGNPRRVLVRAKANIGPDDGAFVYELEQTEAKPGIPASRVVWGERLEGTAADLLAPAAPARGERETIPGRPKGIELAEQFLRERLALGTCSSNVLKAEAEAAGIKWKMLDAASDRIGVLKRKDGFQGKWYWTLRAPPKDAAATAPEPEAEPATAESAGQVKESPEITTQNEQDSLRPLDSLDAAEAELEALLGPAPPPSSFVREPAKPSMKPHRKLFEAAWNAGGSPEQDGMPYLTEDALRRYAATTGYPWQTCANAVEGLVEAGYAEPHLAGWLITDRGMASMMPRMMA